MHSHVPQLLEGEYIKIHQDTAALELLQSQRLPGADTSTVIPDVCKINTISLHTQSPWAKAYRVTVRHFDGTDGAYFMKVSDGHHGHEALKGEFEGTRQMFTIAPDFWPNLIARGTFKADPGSNFYICKFYELSAGVPEPKSFCEKVSRLHSAHTSPKGQFGFYVTTYNGNLRQDDT